MNNWDKLLYMLIGLAAVAVLIQSSAGAQAVIAIGSGIAQLAGNVVGTGQGKTQ